MKFDMTRAWNDAVAMVSGNREVLLIVAGVFFFLPGLTSGLMLPEMAQPTGDSGPEALAYMTEMLNEAAPVLILTGLVQAAGLIALLTLLNDNARPTVGEAIRAGVIGLLPYIGTQLLMILGLGIPLGGLAALAGVSGSTGLVAIVVLVALVALLYVLIKTSLISPVIAIEKRYNPLAVLARSWSLTRGNSLRLFLFYLLLGIAYFVIAMLVGGILGLVIAMMGTGTAATVANGVVSGLLAAAVSILMVGLLAAIHRQLAGPGAESTAKTFD
jgi:hypothetical protein